MKEDLSSEEREILERFQRGELRSTPGLERELEVARQAARNTFNKTPAGEPARDRTRLRARPHPGEGGGHPLPDAAVQHHPQVPVRPPGRKGAGGAVTAARSLRRRNLPQVELPTRPGDRAAPARSR